jgi:hypothetical protein
LRRQLPAPAPRQPAWVEEAAVEEAVPRLEPQVAAVEAVAVRPLEPQVVAAAAGRPALPLRPVAALAELLAWAAQNAVAGAAQSERRTAAVLLRV